MKRTTTDIGNNEVKEGDSVRVLQIDPRLTEKLSGKEKTDVNSMLGEIFEVEEIDEYGSAWVTKWWDRGDGQSDAHSLGLSSSEMELAHEGKGT